MNSSNRSSVNVKELFHSLLTNTTPQANIKASSSPAATATTPGLLTEPPPKNLVRFIENDSNNRREKYDGRRWRLVCTWDNECINIAGYYQLCKKHNNVRKSKEPQGQKRKPSNARSSLPNMKTYNHSHNAQKKKRVDDDDIQILEDYYVAPSHRHSMSNHVKTENPDFNVFSVEHLDEAEPFPHIKSEPRASSSYRPSPTPVEDVQYITSKTRPNGLNINEMISKNIPPLTDFEEECLAVRLIQQFPSTCSMLDAQLYLHKECISVVKQNYRITMDTIAPEYFYDFLLRHPRVALHYSNWFLRCKAAPPMTGCLIDTKVWTLSMIVRGATATESMID